MKIQASLPVKVNKYNMHLFHDFELNRPKNENKKN
jgi:hypothetical protein